jgi:PAS domain S-box-containing protein
MIKDGRKKASQSTIIEKLKDDKTMAQKYLDIVGVMVVAIDSEENIVLINKKGCELLGCKKEEVLGKNWFDTFLPEKFKNEVRSVFRKLMLGEIEPAEYFENPILTKTGEERMILWQNTILKDDAGEIIGTLSSGEDVTESKRAEETLLASEERYHTLFEESPDSILLLDRTGIVLDCNTVTEELTGYSKNEIIGKSFDELMALHIDDIPELRRKCESLSRGMEVESFELEIIRRDGSKRWINIKNTLLKKNDEIFGFQVISRDITVRKQVADALQESEEKYRILVERANDAVVIIQDKLVKFVNRQGVNIIGYSVDELIDTPFINLVAPSELPRLLEIYKRRMSGEIVDVYDTILKHKDGHEVYVEINGGIINYNGRSADMAFVRDITERKKAEESLQVSEERFRSFFENEPEYCYMISSEGIILDINKSALRALGYNKNELVGKPHNSIYHPDYPQQMERIVTQMKKKGKLKNEETVVITKKSKPLTVLLSTDTVKDKNGKILHSISVQRDITERKKLEEVLKRSEAKYRSLVEKAGTGIAVSDVKGRLSYVNEALCKMMGYSEDELIDKPFIDFIHPEDMEDILTLFESAFDNPNQEVQLEFRLIHKKGHTLNMFTQPTVLWQDGKIAGLNAILTDITERKLIENAIEKRNEELSTLNTIAGTINQSLELNKVLNIALEETMHVLNGEGGLISLYDEASQTYIPVIHDGFSEGVMKEVTGFKVGKGIMGQTAQHGVPILVPDLTDETSDLISISVEKGWRSLVSVPLKSKDTLIGVMTLSSREKEHFKPEDMGVLGAIGNQVGMAIENARFYEASQKELSERKKAEKALRKSEVRFRDIVQLLPEAVFEINLDGKFTFANKKAFEISGYSQEDFDKGLNVFLMFIPEDQDRIKENISLILGCTDLGVNEYTAVRKDGTQYPVLIHSSAIFLEGNPVGLRGIIIDITEKKRAEQTLKESEERFRSIVQSSPMGMHMYQLDSEGSLVFTGANPAADAIMGVENKQFIGKVIEDAFPSSRDTEIPDKYRNAAESGEPWHAEQMAYEDDKVCGAFEVHAFQTSPGKMAAMFLDITDRMKAQEAIRESEEKYRNLFEKSPTSITITDKSGIIIDCNKLTEELTGYKKEEIIGRRFDELTTINPRDYSRLREKFAKLSTGEDEKPYELEITTKNGDRRWIIILNSPLWKDDEVIGFQIIARDITRRKKMEEALFESTQKWKTTFDTINDPICIQDTERRIVQFNTAALAFMEKPYQYVLNHDCCQLIHGVSEPIDECPFMRSEKSKQRETLIKQIGDRWFNISVDPILDEDGTFKGAVHMMEDITEVKQAEEQLKRSLDEREILFKELKHRVKNNLQLLSSMVGMQTMRLDDDVALKKFQEIQSVIDTIALIYSRAFEETGISGLNLNDFIEELITGLLKFKTKEDMQINYTITGDNIQLSTDQAIPLALIANELVFNALKHAFPDRKQGIISISLSDENDHITMAIADNGVGLSKDIDVDETKTLGLKLVRNLTQQLGGKCNMVIDKGTRHIIEIPKEVVK